MANTKQHPWPVPCNIHVLPPLAEAQLGSPDAPDAPDAPDVGSSRGQSVPVWSAQPSKHGSVLLTPGTGPRTRSHLQLGQRVHVSHEVQHLADGLPHALHGRRPALKHKDTAGCRPESHATFVPALTAVTALL